MTTSTRTRRSKAEPEEITVSEFKQWLAGVEDMQPDNWSPDPTQWAKIRAKIMLLIDSKIEQVESVAAPQQSVTPYQPPAGPIPRVHEQFESSLDGVAPPASPASLAHRPLAPPMVQTLESDGFTVLNYDHR